jgi:hypothetical protein
VDRVWAFLKQHKWLWCGLFVVSWPVACFLKTNAQTVFNAFNLLICYGLFAASALIFYRRPKLLLTFLVFFIFFFTYRDFCRSLELWFPDLILFFQAYGGRLAYIWASCLALFMVAVWRSAGLRRILVPFLCTLSVVSWAEAVFKIISTPSSRATKDPSFDHIVLKDKPNIYFLMIDGYPGEAVSKNVLGNREDLSSLLRARGFFVPQNTRSNYHFTLASLSSQLQMNYHSSTENFFSTRAVFVDPIAGQNNFVRVLKRNGYQFIFAPSGRLSEMSSQGFEDVSLSSKSDREVFQTFQRMTPLIYLPPMAGAYLEPEDVQSFMSKTRLPTPFFLFAHFLQVHDGVHTVSGNPQQNWPLYVICDKNSLDRHQMIQKQFDTKFIQLIQDIQTNDPNAVIVVSSDHGLPIQMNESMSVTERVQYWSEWRLDITDENMDVRCTNLIAIYAPKSYKSKKDFKVFFKDGMTNVNIFRGVLSILSKQAIPRLDDHFFYLAFDEQKEAYRLNKTWNRSSAKPD